MSDAKHEKDEAEFKVTDKRRFTADGQERSSTPDAPEPKDAPAQQEASTPNPSAQTSYQDAAGPKVPEIDFATFVLSLASSTQVHLGAVPNPATGVQQKDLGLARQTIDILGMIQDKTKGNRTPEEDRLLEHILFDLRMMYVQAGAGSEEKESQEKS